MTTETSTERVPDAVDFATKDEREAGHRHVIGEKCDSCVAESQPAIWQYGGGAISFEEADRYNAAARIQGAVESEMSVFDALLQNIRMSDLEAGEKADAIERLAASLRERINQARAEAEAENAADKASKTEGGTDYQASDYADVPDASKPSTWKLRLAEGRSGNFTVAQVARAITAMQPGGYRGNRVDMGSSKSRVVARIASAIGKADGDAEAKRTLRERLDKVKDMAEEDVPVTEDPGMTSVFKDAGGNWRWVAIHSNKYKDREGEIFSEAAHKAFVDEVYAKDQFPALRLWHIPTDIGRADFVDYDSQGFVVSSGTFLPEWQGAAESLAKMKGLGCSHGYLYRPSDLRGGVYHSYKTYEVSVLPNERAANTLTAFFAGEEIPMLTPERKAFFEAVAGPERVAQIEQGVSALAEHAEKSGLSYKSLEEALLAGRKEDEQPAAAPEPAATPAAPAAEPAQAPAPASPPVERLEVVDPPAAVTPPPAGDVPTPTLEEQQAAAAALAQAGPVAAEDEQTKAIKAAFESATAPITEVLMQVKASNDALVERVTALEASKDDTIAAAIRPRVGPIATVPASMSGANLVDAPAGAKSQDDGERSGAKAAAPYAEDIMRFMGGQLSAPQAV